MEIKLNTKLRLENSALGTYEVDATSGSFNIPKNLTREKFLGTVVSMTTAGGTSEQVITAVSESKDDNGQADITLHLANNMNFSYRPETGVLAILTLDTP